MILPLSIGQYLWFSGQVALLEIAVKQPVHILVQRLEKTGSPDQATCLVLKGVSCELRCFALLRYCCEFVPSDRWMGQTSCKIGLQV